MYIAGEVSVQRACCERDTNLFLLGGGGTINPGSRPAGVITCSPRMVTECFLSRSMLIKMYKYTISWYVPVYVHCIYSQSISCRRSLSLFSLSTCINVFVWHNWLFYQKAWIWVHHYNNYPVWWALSVLAVLLWHFDVQHTSITHVFWCPRQTQHLLFETALRPENHTDWERAPPSGKSGFECTFEKSLPPWTTLSNCPSANNSSAVMKPYRNCRKKLNLVSQVRNTKTGGASLRIARSQSKKISNDQELIQSDPTSCPQNQKGNN